MQRCVFHLGLVSRGVVRSRPYPFLLLPLQPPAPVRESAWITQAWNSRWFARLLVAILLLSVAGYFHHSYRNKSGELNISCFVFRDINRDGVYDLGDRPYAGLPVTLTRANGSHVEARSNLAGFTNFKMSATRRPADIRAEGTYTIEASQPEGWVITSGNETQQTRFRALPGSPAGLVAEATIQPVGLAPKLVVKGVAPHGASLSAENPQGVRQSVALDADGAFEITAARGKWKLTIVDGNGAKYVRDVEVKEYAVVVSLSGLGERSDARKPVERTVDFDALTTSDTLIEVPSGYGGFRWTNWIATHQKLYEGEGFINATVSGEFAAYNSSGHPAFIEHSTGFDVTSMFMGVAWPQAEKHDVVIRAWRGPVLVHEDRLRASTWGPVAFDADYRNVTRVEVSSAAYWQVLIDDFSYRLDSL